MRHARRDYDRIQDPEGLIPEDEPVFLLRGQDPDAATAVAIYAALIEMRRADPKMVKTCRDWSMLMFRRAKYVNRGVADMPFPNEPKEVTHEQAGGTCPPGADPDDRTDLGERVDDIGTGSQDDRHPDEGGRVRGVDPERQDSPHTIRVIIESPYAGSPLGDRFARCQDVERNLRYLRACMRDSLLRGEAPFASHGLYTQADVLDDAVPEERERGIVAGFAWREVAHATVVYQDLGISPGMVRGISHARQIGQSVKYRILGAGWEEHECE